MPKRYVLLIARAQISDAATRGLKMTLERRFGELSFIAVEGNPRAVIIRTDELRARALRSEGVFTVPGGLQLFPVLTSGAISKLKRRAKEAATNDKIHE